MRWLRTTASLVAAALLLTGCGRAASPYITANQRLLALAQPYPGAKVLRIESDPYGAPDSDFGPTIGYTTLAYYVLAKPVGARVVAAFYGHELQGWQQSIETIPCHFVAPPPGAPGVTGRGPCPAATNVSFTNGSALIQLQGLGSGTHYIVAIDSDHAQNTHQ
jgi:hypothetical protein